MRSGKRSRKVSVASGKRSRKVSVASGKRSRKVSVKGVRGVGQEVEKGVSGVGKDIENGTDNAGKAFERALRDIGKAIEKGAQDTGKTLEKGAQDTGKTLEKAVQDTGKAGGSVYKFGVREIEDIGKSVRDADKRLGEGKIVDSIWHLATDQLKHTEENAGKAAQESEVVRVIGQIAASAYGGPGGSAAYAAWLTYNATMDVGLALRVGAITGAAAYATSAVGKIPNVDAAGNVSAGAIAEKTIMAGAIGGAAVAAAGGDQQDLQEGFLKSGGAMLVQSVYEVETEHKLDARASQGEAYCVAAVIQQPMPKCAAPIEAYKKGVDGKPLAGEVDARKLEPRRPLVGLAAKSADAPIIGVTETSKFMIMISKIPGMNAMALLHDCLCYSLNFDTVTKVWTIVPAAVVTYYGTGVPAEDQIRKAAERRELWSDGWLVKR
jgi:hypothetical protein